MSIDALIKQAKEWHTDHIKHGRRIEALACQIRIRALEDAKAAGDK